MANLQCCHLKRNAIKCFYVTKESKTIKEKSGKENAIRKEIRPKFIEFYVISNKYNG